MLLQAESHNSPRNALHIMNKMVNYGVFSFMQNDILEVLQLALVHCAEDAEWLTFIRELHPRQTYWIQARDQSDKAAIPPPPPNSAPLARDYLPTIQSRMLSLAIASGRRCHDDFFTDPYNAAFKDATSYLDCAEYLLNNGAVPDEDHIRHLLWGALWHEENFPKLALELSGLVDLLVAHGLNVAQEQVRRLWSDPEWDDLTLGTIADPRTAILMGFQVTAKPKSIMQLAMTLCLKDYDDFLPLNFQTTPIYGERDLLSRVLPFCRVVYHFLAQGGRLNTHDGQIKYRLVRLGLVFFRPGQVYQYRQSEDVDGFDWSQPYQPQAKNWEVVWDRMLEDYGMAEPPAQLASDARAGRWQPDPSVLTGRGANLHEQVLTAVCLLLGAPADSLKRPRSGASSCATTGPVTSWSSGGRRGQRPPSSRSRSTP
ncbi:hypothetical protein PG988_010951 [Apiospora saccharicola]